jgi:hypothetical protein
MYNGYYGRHCLNFLSVISLCGLTPFLHGPACGMDHDARLYERSGLARKLRRFFRGFPQFPALGISADSAFGVEQGVYALYKARKGKQLTAAQKKLCVARATLQRFCRVDRGAPAGEGCGRGQPDPFPKPSSSSRRRASFDEKTRRPPACVAVTGSLVAWRGMLPPPPVSAAAASDLRTGTCLAVSSSALIGASFCVKKRALRLAGATGLRAGACV